MVCRYVCMPVCAYAYICAYTRMHMYACVCRYEYLSASVYVCIYVYIYIYIYSHPHCIKHLKQLRPQINNSNTLQGLLWVVYIFSDQPHCSSLVSIHYHRCGEPTIYRWFSERNHGFSTATFTLSQPASSKLVLPSSYPQKIWVTSPHVLRLTTFHAEQEIENSWPIVQASTLTCFDALRPNWPEILSIPRGLIKHGQWKIPLTLRILKNIIRRPHIYDIRDNFRDIRPNCYVFA